MAKEELKYEEAMATLEQIVARMENNELDLDTMSEQLKKAQRLIKLCKARNRRLLRCAPQKTSRKIFSRWNDPPNQ